MSTTLLDRKRVVEGFAPLMADAVRQIRRSANGIGQSERQHLRDCARARYGFAAVEHLADISATCENDADALALPETIRAYIVARRGSKERMGFHPATMRETAANYHADVAQLDSIKDFTRCRLDRLVEALLEQEAATRRLLDEVHIERGLLALAVR